MTAEDRRNIQDDVNILQGWSDLWLLKNFIQVNANSYCYKSKNSNEKSTYTIENCPENII